MLNKTKAIVLHHVDYGESSIIVTLYTEKHGRISCMVNSVRTKKPKFAATLFQPLTIIEIDLYYRAGREIHRIKDVNSPVHYQTIPFSFTKNAIALFLAEVLYLVLREEESNPGLFDYLYSTLQIFDSSQSGVATFHHWFMIQLSRYLGFLPNEYLDENALEGGDMQAFGNLSHPVREILYEMLNSPNKVPLVKLTHSERNQLLDRIIMYYSIHIDGFSRLRSFNVLQEVFEK